jgi:DNA gyrase/topoisomerase IV subunit A
VADNFRLGVVERSVLEALDQIGARHDRIHRKSANVVGVLARDFGVSPRYAYDAICTLALPWLLHIPLVDFHGNYGSADEADRPAGPRYTEARLSAAGAIVLAAERGLGPRVPVMLINGDLHADGSAPPFSPARVIDALLALVDDPRVGDDEIVERVGLPASPTGCEVACDYVALAAGAQTAMRLTARLHHEQAGHRHLIVLTHLPLGIGDSTVEQALGHRVNVRARDPRWGPGDFEDLALPLRDVQNESRDYTTRIVCELLDTTDPARCEAQILSTWGVVTRPQVKLAAPLPQLVRELVDVDPDAQRAAIAALGVV